MFLSLSDWLAVSHNKQQNICWALRQWESQEAENKVTPNFQQILLYNTDFTVNNTIELI